MQIEKLNTETLVITNIKNLDPITVFFITNGEGAGRIIVQCYRQAWTGYWNSMGCPLKQFIIESDYDYVASRLVESSYPQSDWEWDYINRIVKAIQVALRLEKIC